MTKFWKDQHDYLSHAIQLEERGNPVLMNLTMVSISILLIGFLTWASFTKLNEVARTPGEITPLGQSKTVQHSDGGTVVELLVKDGETVVKNQLLVKLSGLGIKEDLSRALARDTVLNMEEERLRAGLENRTPDFKKFAGSSVVVNDHVLYSQALTNSANTDIAVIHDQIDQKQRVIEMLQGEKRAQQQNEAIAADIFSKREVLNKQGYISNLRLTEARQNLTNIQAQIASLEGKIGVVRAEISEGRSRISALQNKRVEGMSADLDKLMADKMENTETIAKLRNRLNHLEIKAPESGVIKGMAINHEGDVVRPGETIMEIVPTNEEFSVEVKIPPQYIGHVKEGQEVHVKFSSFDFSRYGYTAGKLHDISASTFSTDKGERYYKAQVKLDRDYVGSDDRNRIIPGMTVMAEIITGQKSILAYLLKPIQTSFSTAFNER